jgi:hypothetical protein
MFSVSKGVTQRNLQTRPKIIIKLSEHQIKWIEFSFINVDPNFDSKRPQPNYVSEPQETFNPAPQINIKLSLVSYPSIKKWLKKGK